MAEANQGITRRQALKRGLVIGTGVVWATPAVQIIRISEAYAQTTSGGVTNPPGNGGPGNGGPGNGGPGNGGPGNGGPGNGGPGTGGPGTEVGGKVVVQQPTPGGSARAPTTEVEAETLPVTGMDVLPLAAAGAGLMAAGAASLQIANQLEGSEGSAEEIPAGPDDDLTIR